MAAHHRIGAPPPRPQPSRPVLLLEPNSTRDRVGGLGTSLVRARVEAPYLARDLYAFLASLPASFFLDHTFHSATIERRYPAFASIPFENKSAHLRLPRPVDSMRFSAGLASFLARRHSALVRKTFLVPRITYGAINLHYAAHGLPGPGLTAVYLMQLEMLAAGAS